MEERLVGERRERRWRCRGVHRSFLWEEERHRLITSGRRVGRRRGRGASVRRCRWRNQRLQRICSPLRNLPTLLRPPLHHHLPSKLVNHPFLRRPTTLPQEDLPTNLPPQQPQPLVANEDIVESSTSTEGKRTVELPQERISVE